MIIRPGRTPSTSPERQRTATTTIGTVAMYPTAYGGGEGVEAADSESRTAEPSVLFAGRNVTARILPRLILQEYSERNCENEFSKRHLMRLVRLPRLVLNGEVARTTTAKLGSMEKPLHEGKQR